MSVLLAERIEGLSDYQAVRLLEQCSERVFDGLVTPGDELVLGVADQLRESPELGAALGLTPAQRDAPLSEAVSAEVARALLRRLAEDPDLAPLVEKSLDEYRDDELMVGAILATGVAASMVIVAATTQLEAKLGDDVVIKKKAAPLKDATALVKEFTTLLSKVLPGKG
jgi:hypothetical protein